MMKQIFSAVVVLVSSGYVLAAPATAQLGAAAKAEAASEDNIQIVVRPELSGMWGMEIPSNKQCVEYYNFRGNNEAIIKSDKEWTVAQYQYQPQSNRSGDLATLLLHVQYDNNEMDCSRNQEDQTGDLQQFFVKWLNPQKIEFCADKQGQKCFAVLNKQLP